VKESYRHKNLGSVTLERIEQANKIIEEYQQQGYTLTVRQIYYQFVARDLIENKARSYKLIANALEKGRMNGYIDWETIEDRTRSLRGNTHWDSPSQILDSAASGYKLNSREDQSSLVEVWIEKDALIGVISSVCQELDIDYFSCRGYVSLSALWRAARRYKYEDKPCIILHMGDHDPSGLDMTRVIGDTLATFGCDNIEVRRIALNMDQVEEYNPPPNFAKITDTRSGGYIAQHGDQSWELDALSPDVMVNLIKDEVDKLTDDAKQQKLLRLQEKDKEKLQEVADNWESLQW